MSNNKQTMKLYTEEQVRKLLDKMSLVTERKNLGVSANFRHRIIEIDNLIKSETPIELPSDEEIDAHVEEDFLNSTEVHKYSEEAQLLMKAMCKAGALWMRDKIQGGNNEQ